MTLRYKSRPLAWQQFLYQRMQNFFMCPNRKKVLLYSIAAPHALYVILRHELDLHQFSGGKNTHAGRAEGFE